MGAPALVPMSVATAAAAVNVADHLGVAMSRPLRVAVVGLGGRGTIYARLLASNPSAAVVQIAEPRAAVRGELGDELGLPPEAQLEDWRELAAGPRLADAVVLAVQDRFHLEAVVAFAGAGYDILCEKPLAGTEAACAEVVAAAEQAGVFLGVCHVLRFTPTT